MFDLLTTENHDTSQSYADFLQLSELDITHIGEMRERFQLLLPELLEGLYFSLENIPAIKHYLTSPEQLQRIKAFQEAYFRHLLSGHFDAEYLRGRAMLGARLQQENVPPFVFMAAYQRFLSQALSVVRDLHRGDALKIEMTLNALLKVVFFDLSLVADAYVSSQFRLVQQDLLTGLANRQCFDARLAEYLSNDNVPAKDVAVLLLDVDQFSSINQNLGPHVGNALLKKIAQRLRDYLPTHCSLSRYGDDEFAILQPEVAHREAINVLCDGLHTIFLEPFNVEGHHLHLSISIGVALRSDDSHQSNALIKRATIALHKAKNQGRNQTRFFTDADDASSLQRLLIENGLHKAVERKEFCLHYQLQIEREPNPVVTVEALLRWRHPELGWVPPDQFIPIAESCGQMEEIGRWVLHEACQATRQLQLDTGLPLRMSINLSHQQFRDPHLARNILDCLSQHGLITRNFAIEIKESFLQNTQREVLPCLLRLHAEGVQITLDDFGTGSSTFIHLRDLPVDNIKIDRVFISEVTQSQSDAAIVRSLITLAHHLGLRVVAEGVETVAQHAFLNRLQCDAFQGYHFARPVPYDELLKSLQNRPDFNGEHLSPDYLLLVDDEKNVLESLRRVLHREPYKLLITDSCKTASEYLAQYPVGVILCDQRMREISGVKFLSQVRSMHPDCVRIILTGFTELKSVIESVNDGAVYKFLTKPWDDEDLKRNIREAFVHHKLQVEVTRLRHEIESNQQIKNVN